MCGKMVLSKKGMNTMRRTYLALSDEDRDYFITLSKKRTIQAQIVDRAKILLYKSDGMTFNAIAEKACQLVQQPYGFVFLNITRAVLKRLFLILSAPDAI